MGGIFNTQRKGFYPVLYCVYWSPVVVVWMVRYRISIPVVCCWSATTDRDIEGPSFYTHRCLGLDLENVFERNWFIHLAQQHMPRARLSSPPGQG